MEKLILENNDCAAMFPQFLQELHAVGSGNLHVKGQLNGSQVEMKD